jgi:hypothetical protein
LETLMLLLASSGVFQQFPAVSPVPDSLRPVAAVAERVAVGPTAGADASAPASWLPADASSQSSDPVGPVERTVLAPLRPDFFGGENAPQRPRAVEYSEAYHVRLTIHHLASFATLPLFVAEYILGQKLYTAETNLTAVSQSTRSAHRTVAAGVAGLFAVNTVTGAWNLWDSRKSKEGALRRYLHSGLMFLADAGFVATGLTALHGSRRFVIDPATLQSQRRTHRTIAMASMGTALASYGMMLLWKD